MGESTGILHVNSRGYDWKVTIFFSYEIDIDVHSWVEVYIVKVCFRGCSSMYIAVRGCIGKAQNARTL